MSIKLLVGDCREKLRELPDNSVHVVCTSPPYYGLRAYGTNPQVWGGDPEHEHVFEDRRYYVEGGGLAGGSKEAFSKPGTENAERIKAARWRQDGICPCGAWRGELGGEPTPDQFVANLVEVFREVRRVMHPSATLWLNLGDSYAGSGKGPTGHNGIGDQSRRQGFREGNPSRYAGPAPSNRDGLGAVPGLKPKDLMLMPYRVALALQADGWWIRSQIAWCLSGGTQVYVRSQKGDMSMSVKDMARLDPKTLQLWNGERWTRVVRMWESADQGDPIEIELRSGERIGCTPNHLWPTERGLLHAKDLKVGDRLKRVRLPEPDVPRKPSALDDEDVGWFVGLYLAEGCGGTNALQIASHVKETERFERVQRIAQAFDGSASVHHVGGKSATIRVYGRILRAIIEEYIYGKGAHGKHLTNACWRRSNVFLRGLLDGYLHGDGHWEEKNQRWRVNFARNYEFAADLRTLCARLGVSLRLRPRFATLNERKFPTFRGEIRFTRGGTIYDKSNEEIVNIGFSKGRKFWDIEVEDEPHTFALASGVLTHNCKTSAMPESVTDRPSSAWEPIFLLSKSAKYFFDATAVRQPATMKPQRRFVPHPVGRGPAQQNGSAPTRDEPMQDAPEGGANLRNFWLLGPSPLKESHYAAFVPEIPRRAILAGTSERGACSAKITKLRLRSDLTSEQRDRVQRWLDRRRPA